MKMCKRCSDFDGVCINPDSSSSSKIIDDEGKKGRKLKLIPKWDQNVDTKGYIKNTLKLMHDNVDGKLV